MMSKRNKQELTEEIYPRYLKAGKAEKTKILGGNWKMVRGLQYKLEQVMIA
jgi:hypothetical protein